MNIQIFGITKCFDTKKAQRYFKERGIKAQFINLKEKSMSKGELTSVARAVGGLEPLINPKTKDKAGLAVLRCAMEEDWINILIDHPEILTTPIVRNGQKATIGVKTEVWKNWE